LAEPIGTMRRLAGIFAADVEGYSRLMEADEVATRDALTAHRRKRLNRKRNGPAAEAPSHKVTLFSPDVGRVAAGLKQRHEKALSGAGATGQGFEERAATMLEATHTETN
jgi:hypothetical protein